MAASILALSASAHADDAKLRILGATGTASTITRTSATATVDQTVVIQSLVNDAVTSAVDVGPLVDPRGVSFDVSARLNGSPDRTVTIPPLGIAALRITATLPVQAEYSAEVTVTYGGMRQSARLVVIRTMDPLSVAIIALEPVLAEASSTATLDVVLQETSGRTIALDRFDLGSFTIKVGEAKYQEHPKVARVDGEPFDGTSKPLVIAPYQTRRVPIVLDELRGAGEYSGTIWIGAAGMKPIEQPFTLVLREARIRAAECLILGCMLALALRFTMAVLRPRLTRERRLAIVAQQLEEARREPLVEDERDVLAALDQAVESQRDAMRRGTSANSETAVVVLEARLQLAGDWMARRRELGAIEPVEAREEVNHVLDAARAEIISPAATETSLGARREELGQLTASARHAVQQALKTRIGAMRADLDAASTDPSRPIGPAVAAQVLPLVDQATAQLDKQQLSAALRSYTTARGLWLVLLLDDLDAELAGPAPSGFQGDWQPVAGTIRSDLTASRSLLPEDPDAAIRRYRSARGRYLAVVASGLMHAIGDTQADLTMTTGDPATKAAAITELTAAGADAAAARLAAATGKLDEASLALERARLGLRRARPVQRKLGDDAPAAESRSALAIQDDLRDVPGAASPVPQAKLVASRKRLISLIDVAVALLGIGVATLVGLGVLWEPNLRWGGFWSHVTAVLWGLGLQGATFSGATAVIDRLSGKAMEKAS